MFLDTFDFPFFFTELRKTTTKLSQEEFFNILFQGVIDQARLKGNDGELYSIEKSSISRILKNKQPLSEVLVEAIQHDSMRTILPTYFMEELCPLLNSMLINNLLDSLKDKIEKDSQISKIDRISFLKGIELCYEDKKGLPSIISTLFIYTVSLYAKSKASKDIKKRKTTRLPIEKISEQIDTESEGRYLNALLEVFSEKDGKEYTQQNIGSSDFAYKDTIQRHRRDFFSAKCVERNCRDVYPKDENQFNVFKDEIYDGIIDKYEEDYESGFKRLSEVLSQVTKVEIGKSVLMKETVWIGASERKGTCHILVNDGKLKGWK